MATDNLDDVTGAIVDAAVKLHRGLGPGLLESVYETVLARDLVRRGWRLNVSGCYRSSTTGYNLTMRFAQI